MLDGYGENKFEYRQMKVNIKKSKQEEKLIKNRKAAVSSTKLRNCDS